MSTLELPDLGTIAEKAIAARCATLDARRFRHPLSDAEQAELAANAHALRQVQALRAAKQAAGPDAMPLDVAAAQSVALRDAGLASVEGIVGRENLDALARRALA